MFVGKKVRMRRQLLRDAPWEMAFFARSMCCAKPVLVPKLSLPRTRSWPKRVVLYQKSITFSTSGHRDMHDITEGVAGIVREARVRVGVVQLFSVGSTAALGTLEFEPGLVGDLPDTLDKLIPPSRNYGHEQAWHDGNGHSHIQASLLGPSLTVPISDGRLVLGTWQQIFHLECDVKPRRRTVVVTVFGEG
jgi:secondary thiamine-phosphate synthase enzyme